MTLAQTSAMRSRHQRRCEPPRRPAAICGLGSPARHQRFIKPVLTMIAVALAGAGFVSAPAAARDFCISCSQPEAVYSCQVETGFTLPAEAAAKLHCIKELARRGAHRSCSVSRRNDDVPCEGEAVVLAPPSAIPAGPDSPPANLPAAMPPNALPSGRPSEVIGSQGEQDYRYAPAQPAPQRDDARTTVDERHNGGVANQQHERPPSQGPEGQADQTVQDEPKKRSNKPPKTVEEMAKRAAEDSQKGLKQAGELVTDTAKSTGKTIENAGKAVGNAAKKTWDCVSSLFSKC